MTNTPSVVEQLQAAAIDPQVRVSDLVRKAKLVASKLRLGDFERWTDAELQGYPDGSALPAYRQIRGTPVWWNPYRGWLAVNFSGDGVRWADKMSRTDTSQPIGELETLAAEYRQAAESWRYVPFNAELTEAICQSKGVPPTQIGLQVDRSVISGVLDAVRTAVLEWALKLEKSGILGNSIRFSDKEKEIAHQPSIIYQISSIESFVGNLWSNLRSFGNFSENTQLVIFECIITK